MCHYLVIDAFHEALGTDLERRLSLVGTVLQHVISGLIQCERGIFHRFTAVDDIRVPIRATMNIRQITIGLVAAEKLHTTG